MPERENLFAQAENDRFDVSNVLNDKNVTNTLKIESNIDDEPVINVEKGAPFIDGIDPDATIEEYKMLNAEPELEEVENEELAEEEIVQAAAKTRQHRAIRAQANKARESFINDLDALENEPAMRRIEETDEQEDIEETPAETSFDEEILENEEAAPTTKDILRTVTGRIKKPRFAKKQNAKENESLENNGTAEQESSEEKEETPNTVETDEIQRQEDGEEYQDRDEKKLDEELAEAQAAQKKGASICDGLYHLQNLLEESRAPLFHKTEVLVPRERTLRLVRSLTAICEVDPSYMEGASEDNLVDRLISEQSDDDYRPLERARERAENIIKNATKQADLILNDAKTLAKQLLTETEAEIKAKYDEADEQIAVRLSTTKEESTKKLNAARSELTISRQRSVEILSKYLEKAESDYEGYWERAENTVMASLEQSDQILGKAADIYRKELATIHQDKEEIVEILEHLKKQKRRAQKK